MVSTCMSPSGYPRENSSMTKVFSVCIAALAILTTTASADAQSYSHGYQFGSGFRSFNDCGRFDGLGGGFSRTYPREQLPYFAQFPPVYYSHIVPRPIGFSPYALPPGIMPAEMQVAPPVSTPNPTVIPNPYYGTATEGMEHEQAAPVNEKVNENATASTNVSAETAAKTQQPKWQSNPYFVDPQPDSLALSNFVE